ncbi:hypothetical protein BSBH6_03720 [Bacillus subtilis]|nr:hypothetical protein BSBH6_03720 [Bacillus subtilis]
MISFIDIPRFKGRIKKILPNVLEGLAVPVHDQISYYS